MRAGTGQITSPLDILCKVAAAENSISAAVSPDSPQGPPLPSAQKLPPILPVTPAGTSYPPPEPVLPGPCTHHSRLSCSAPAASVSSFLAGPGLSLAPLRGPGSLSTRGYVERQVLPEHNLEGGLLHGSAVSCDQEQERSLLSGRLPECQQPSARQGNLASCCHNSLLADRQALSVALRAPVPSTTPAHIHRNVSAPSLRGGAREDFERHAEPARPAAVAIAPPPQTSLAGHTVNPVSALLRISGQGELNVPPTQSIPVPRRNAPCGYTSQSLQGCLPGSAPSAYSPTLYGCSPPSRSRVFCSSMGATSFKSVASRSATKVSGRRDSYTRFTAEEEAMLLEGVRVFGVGNWKKILNSYRFHWKRTAVDLKDKYRNITRAKIRRMNACSQNEGSSVAGDGDFHTAAGSLSVHASLAHCSPLQNQVVTVTAFSPISPSAEMKATETGRGKAAHEGRSGKRDMIDE